MLQVGWGQQAYLKEPAHRTQRGDAVWRAMIAAVRDDYVFQGVPDGLMPDQTLPR